MFAAAILIAFLPDRSAAYRHWLYSFIKLNCPWWVYAVTLLPLPLISGVLTLALGITAKASAHIDPLLVWATLFPASILNGLAQIAIGAGPLGEEPGWRGFVLPNLLMRFGDLGASAILGVTWAIWHLPIMLFYPEWRGFIPFTEYLPLFAVDLTLMAYCTTKIWRWSNGSMFLMIWLHGVLNVVWSFVFTAPLWNVQEYSRLSREALFTLVLVLFALVVWGVGHTGPARRRAAGGLLFDAGH